MYIDAATGIYALQIPKCATWNQTGITVAGRPGGAFGSALNQLDGPVSIFVDNNYTLYIADRDNNRIMKWTLGATEGVRVAGDGTDGSSNTQVSHPTQLIVDEDENLYILEGGNARISRWKANTNFGECIVACTGINGIKNNQLNGPSSLAFDSYGNIYVSEWDSNQVKKFQANPGPSIYTEFDNVPLFFSVDFSFIQST